MKMPNPVYREPYRATCAVCDQAVESTGADWSHVTVDPETLDPREVGAPGDHSAMIRCVEPGCLRLSTRGARCWPCWSDAKRAASDSAPERSRGTAGGRLHPVALAISKDSATFLSRYESPEW